MRPRLDCGWNIPAMARETAIKQMKGWIPRSPIDERDKKIVLLAMEKDMNAAQIERLKDKKIIRYKRNGEPTGALLGTKGILNVIHQYVPATDRPRGYSLKTEGRRKRAELGTNRDRLTEGKPRFCAICGTKENLRLHHIVPVDHGGTNSPYNLIYLCHDCHSVLHREIYKTWGEGGQSKTAAATIKRERPPAARKPPPKHRRRPWWEGRRQSDLEIDQGALELAMINKGMNYKELAEAAGFSPGTIYAAANKKRRPSLPLLEKISKALNVQMNTITTKTS